MVSDRFLESSAPRQDLFRDKQRQLSPHIRKPAPDPGKPGFVGVLDFVFACFQGIGLVDLEGFEPSTS